MVAGLISPIKSAFGNILERSTLLMLKGLFESILSVEVVDVYMVDFVCFGMTVCANVTPLFIRVPLSPFRF